MRIKEIKVEGLFGMFTHTIPLNLDSHLTIIYGENGIGKTMIFRLLHWLFCIRRSTLNLKNAPFTSLDIKFETGNSILVDNHLDSLTIRYTNELGIGHHLSVGKSNVSLSNNSTEDWTNGLNVDFIETQRLFYLEEKEGTNNNILEYTATQYADDLVQKIKEKTEAYRKISDDLKNSLSDRILSKSVKTDYTVTELQALAKDVEDRRKELKDVGLISNGNSNFHIPNDIGDLDKAILAVNIQDMQTQLEIYEKDNFHARLKLFIEILNERRLSYKKIRISESNGFSFTNDNGQTLNPKDLSSGEQHELVLLYRLLFEIPENSLILIDEPEISLHITWQKAFISDMEDIIKLRNFDILIATHSPSIINGNWDLTVSLKGGRDEEKP